MKREPEELILTRTSAMYLKGGYLTEACDLFDAHAKDAAMIYHSLPAKYRIKFLESMHTWTKEMNSEQARELIKRAGVNKKNPAELHYYILSLRKKYMYPLIPFTWMFV